MSTDFEYGLCTVRQSDSTYLDNNSECLHSEAVL